MSPQQPDAQRIDSGTNTTRRRALVALATGVAALAAALPLARRLTARLRTSEHRALPPDPEPVDPTLLRRMATFAGALFGHRLDERDTRDLAGDLALLVQRDGGWRAEFAESADYLDRLARTTGARAFADASDGVRDAIVDDIMRPSIASRRSRVLATVSRNERVRRRMRAELVERLATAYAASAPAWRRRGYTRIPGQSGDPLEYTRAGTAAEC